MKKGKEKIEKIELSFDWRVHTPNLLQEIISGHSGGWIFNQPLRILGSMLGEVGKRAAEINDPELNALMCRLTIYSIANPSEPEYDLERFKSILEEAQKIKAIRTSSAVERFQIVRISRAGITEGYFARCKGCGGTVANRKNSSALYKLIAKPGFNCKICVPYVDTPVL